MTRATSDARPQVHLLVGFLGSGKTTLLRRMLRDPAFAGTAVLINEIGEVGLDHILAGVIEGEPVLLESGCICCTIRGDLAAALRRLIARRRDGAIPEFARVVIETTGLADPTPIVATLLGDLVVLRALRLGRIVCTIDAVHGIATLERPVGRKQAAVADTLAITKTDLSADTAALEAALRTLNPNAAIIRAMHGEIDAEILLAGPTTARDWVTLAADPAPHDATSFVLTHDTPLDYGAFALWFSLMVHRHGDRLLRVKALLDVAGSDAPVALHAVQHVIHPPEHLPAWTGPRRSAIVFVTDGLPRAIVARSLRAFLG